MAGGYEIAIDFIPFYINYSLVNDILFVGQIVGILNENPRNNSGKTNYSYVFWWYSSSWTKLIQYFRRRYIQWKSDFWWQRENVFRKIHYSKSKYFYGHGGIEKCRSRYSWMCSARKLWFMNLIFTVLNFTT